MVLSPIVLVTVAFFCGVIVGGIAVALQRAAAIERIKQQFRAELETILAQNGAAANAQSEASGARPRKQGGGYDPGRAA